MQTQRCAVAIAVLVISAIVIAAIIISAIIIAAIKEPFALSSRKRRRARAG